MKHVVISALLIGALIAEPALAQPAPGAPPAGAPAGRGPGGGGRGPQMPSVKGPAGPFAPVAIPPEKNIPLAQALDAAQTALDACLKLPRTSAASVMVVDLNGNMRVALSADNTGLAFYDFARRKAYTVLKKKMPSGVFGALPEVVAAGRGAVLEGDPELITFPGALPIMKGGEMIGVLSVSGPTGGNDDLKCTEAGMAKFKL
jgi:uncharacterized protein GlcG (DUF336 family)